MENVSDHVLPSSSRELTPEEEENDFIISTLQSQNEFKRLDLNQVYYLLVSIIKHIMT